MRNDGTGNFLDVAKQSGDYFHRKYVGRGATRGDYDNDGDVDLLVVNLNDSPRLLRNDGGNRNNWLSVVPKLPGSNRDAVGARVTVTSGSLVQVEEVAPVQGYLSQGDPRVHFGLANHTAADVVEIRWPDGSISRRKNVPGNQFLTVVQDEQPAK